MLCFTNCDKRRRNYQKRKSDRKTMRDFVVSYSIVLMMLSFITITISISFIVGFVMAFQPLPSLNQLSQLRNHQYTRYSHSQYHPLRLVTSQIQSFVRGSDSILHLKDINSTETDGILTTESDVVIPISKHANTTNSLSNDSFYTHDVPSTTTGIRLQVSSFKDQIQKCKDSVNIIDVIESYSLEQFHRTGTDRAMAICPFHEDHHPSLHIDASKQMYKCFACNAGGDVIHFVQEYSKLSMNQIPNSSELSFVQALQYIQQKFGDGTTTSFSKPTFASKKVTQESAETIQKKGRILLANAYAAIYFTNCLKESYAGGARYYLRSDRGLSLPTFKTIMIGYAPDTYYDYRLSSCMGNNGPNSLVNQLLQSGFTSQEILDSGLAVMRKNHSVGTASTKSNVDTGSSMPIHSVGHTNISSINDAVWQNSSLLMDRFRGRIMVPILDEFGTNVLGFGGRIIPTPESDEMDVPSSSTFKAAKYLNSPESLAFEKRKILFNQHIATKAIHTRGRTSPILPLILVEGYLDAISLWDIGIYNVVATMGTAISTEQLDQASKTAGCRGGKIVVCLDNDSAGTTAMERLCRNKMLEDCIRKNVVSVYVARLPDLIKDPADFIESRRKLGMTVQQIATAFRNEVVETAIDWTDWYVQHLIAGYDRDAPRNSAGSFSDVFERIADFLANSLTPAERTKVAYEVAGQLSSVLATDRNSSDISLSVRIQLESDLIDLTSRLSAAKEVLQRRIDAASADTTTKSIPPTTVTTFTSGLGPNSIDQDSKLSKNATRGKAKVSNQVIRRSHTDNKSVVMPAELPQRKVQTTRTRARTTISRSREPNYVSVTTHFSGFQFQHQSDMDWLGLQSSKFKKAKTNTLVLGQYHQTSTEGKGDAATPREKQVYFNSAGFNGYQFLTDTAINAGYKTRSFKPDTSMIEHGLSSIVEQDVISMIESAENTLLKILVKDCATRSVVKNMMTARQAVNFGGGIQWSTSEKRWLFDLLVYGVDAISDAWLTDVSRNDLRYFLAHHPNAPPGAFSQIEEVPIAHKATLLPSSGELTVTDTLNRSDSYIEFAPIGENNEIQDVSLKFETSTGTLDLFFDDETIPNESCIDNDIALGSRNELAVQETLVSLLWASTAQKSKNIQQELVSSSNHIIEKKLVQTKDLHDNANEHHIIVGSLEQSQSSASTYGEGDADLQGRNSSSTSHENDKQFKFDKYQLELLMQLRDTTQTLKTLKESSNRIALRLLDESSSTGIEGSISQALQVDLASKLDDHVRDVRQYDLYPEPGINDIPYEIELERMAEEWGDWYNDDYVWTPGECAKVSTMNQIAENQDVMPESDLERETLEEFFVRVDREWNGWDS